VSQNNNSPGTGVEVALVAPRQWRFTPESGECTVEPGAVGTISFRVWISNQVQFPTRQVLLAELILDGHYRGQRAESIIFVDRERKLNLA
jgi:hypothetical protein